MRNFFAQTVGLASKPLLLTFAQARMACKRFETAPSDRAAPRIAPPPAVKRCSLLLAFITPAAPTQTFDSSASAVLRASTGLGDYHDPDWSPVCSVGRSLGHMLSLSAMHSVLPLMRSVCAVCRHTCEHSACTICRARLPRLAPADDTDSVYIVKAGMGEPVKQALKEAERAAKKQKLCVDVSTSGISAMLRNLVAAREQVGVRTNIPRLRYMRTRRAAVIINHHGYCRYSWFGSQMGA